MEHELFDLVLQAQKGDVVALNQLIIIFRPSISNARFKVKSDRQDDLEQSIVETLIRKIKTYDMSKIPDFTSFCDRLIQNYDFGNKQPHELVQQIDSMERETL